MAAERLIEVLVPTEHEEAIHRVVRSSDLRWSWHQSADGNTVFKLALPANKVESILDPLEPVLERIDDARLVVLPVEAMLPRRDDIDGGEGREEREETGRNGGREGSRLSREELYLDVKGWTHLSRDYLAMTVLSTVVATVGLAKDNPVIVVAAMVIAPLLGPNMAVSVATTLGDRKLLFDAVRNGLVGISIAAASAFLSTALLPFDLANREISSRTVVDLADIALGLASGAAGALAITSGVATSLVGVMVAVALLPPLVVTAGLLAQGRPDLAAGAALLLAANLACVNLSSLAVFFLQGVRPRGWSESKRSARLTAVAIAAWMVLLAALIAAVLLYQHP